MFCIDWVRAGGVANPYISVEVGDEKRRTAVEPGTVDPVWDEEIMVFSEITARNVSSRDRIPSSTLSIYGGKLSIGERLKINQVMLLHYYEFVLQILRLHAGS